MVTYFLNDFAEFGRKVIIKPQQPKYSVDDQSTYRQTSKTPFSPSVKNGIRGGYLINTIGFENGVSKRVTRTRNYFRQLNPSELADKNTLKKRRVYSRETLRGIETKSQENVNGKLLQQRPFDKNPIRLTKEESKKILSKKTATTPTSTSVNSTPKSSRKLINKYTLGAAGLVGAGLTGLGAYKLLTRKKKDK